MPFLGPSLRRRRVTDRPAVRTAVAVLASLALNALIVLVLARLGVFDVPKPGSRPQAVALAPLSPEQWASNRAVGGVQPPSARPAPRPQAQRLPPPPTPPPPEKQTIPGQVVDVAPSKDQRPPSDARFYSEHNSNVEKETRSRYAGTRKFENTLPTPSEGPKKAPPQARGEEGTAGESKPGKEAPEQRGTGADRLAMPKQPAQDRLALAPRPDGAGGGDVKIAPREDRPRIPGTADQLQVPGPVAPEVGGGQKRSGPMDSRLLPSAASMARIAGGPAPDALDGVEEGDGTWLRTREFMYATYINRVKAAIAQEWNPTRALDARDPERKIYPNVDRRTDIEMTIDAGGRLHMVRVRGPSGLDFLDQEIVRAARSAAPFPNPPPGLMGSDGFLHYPLSATVTFSQAGHFQMMVPVMPSQRPYPE